jgi:hypothetical protein
MENGKWKMENENTLEDWKALIAPFSGRLDSTVCASYNPRFMIHADRRPYAYYEERR